MEDGIEIEFGSANLLKSGTPYFGNAAAVKTSALLKGPKVTSYLTSPIFNS
jgi:hypothetical protein